MSSCIFCENIHPTNILAESQHFFVCLDIDPIQEGHILLISKKHYLTLLEIPDNVLLDLFSFEKKIINLLENEFHVLGVSVLQNNGAIMDEGTHFHVHLVPRYKNDAFWDSQYVSKTSLNLKLLKHKLNQLT